MTEPHSHWEEHYSAKPRVWSGRVNARLAEVVPRLSGVRALDLGCGEGADAIWLAENGWEVVAVDVSTTALARAAEDAEARGALSRIDFQAHDLERTFPEGSYDLVSAQFFHTPLEMDRTAVLRRAVAAVAPGGTLLIVDHGEAPPWAKFGAHHHHEFPSAADVLAGLALDTAEWEPVRVGPAEREAVGPEGEHAHLVDNVIELRRK
jgi:SAM-dependent methyltransferase